MTLGGQTFLDMQVAPHQAEASRLAKQLGTHYEEHEAMNNSASTSNVVEFLGDMFNTYHQSSCHQ